VIFNTEKDGIVGNELVSSSVGDTGLGCLVLSLFEREANWSGFPEQLFHVQLI
jgi:hypothetical protein